MNKVQVVAKKITITKGIMEQLPSPSLKEMEDSIVLGWCSFVFGSGKFKKRTGLIIMQTSKNELRRWRMPQTFETQDFLHSDSTKNDPKPYFLYVQRSGFVDEVYRFATKEERDLAKRRMDILKNVAVDTGQFLY